MKKLNGWKSIAAMIFGVVGFAPAVAKAAIVDGMYESRSNGRYAQTFIKTVKDNDVVSSYALVLWSESDSAIFRVEEVDEHTQAWVQLFQSKDHILSTDIRQQATYMVQTLRDSHGAAKMIVAPTDFGARIKCRNSYEFYQSGNGYWNSLALVRPELNGGQASLVQSGQDQYLFKGLIKSNIDTLTISEVFPGMGVVRAQKLDSESRNGWSLARPVEYVAVSIRRWFFFKPFDEVKLIHLPAGEQGCTSTTYNFYN